VAESESEESGQDKIDCESLLHAIDLCKEQFQQTEEQGKLEKAAGAVYLISIRMKKGLSVDESLFQKQLNFILDNERYSQFLETEHPALMQTLQNMDIAFGIDAVDEMTNDYYENDDYGFSK